MPICAAVLVAAHRWQLASVLHAASWLRSAHTIIAAKGSCFALPASVRGSHSSLPVIRARDKRDKASIMSAWASADAAALKKGEATDDHFGLLLLAYPVSEELRAAWADAKATLERDHRLNGAYWMPPEHLHVTIATLRRYDAAKLNPADREVTLNEWRHILDGAKISQGWPPAPFRLRVTGATFRGGCATLDISDEDGAIAAMRAALELSIRARGGHAVVGGGDRSKGRPPSVCAASDPPPHLPDICHCTVRDPCGTRPASHAIDAKRDAGHAVGGGAKRPGRREGGLRGDRLPPVRACGRGGRKAAGARLHEVRIPRA